MEVNTERFVECKNCGILFSFNKVKVEELTTTETKFIYVCPCCKTKEIYKKYYYCYGHNPHDFYLDNFIIRDIVID
jgi:hypothetical protein